MTVKGKILPFDGCVELVDQVVDDFLVLSKYAASDIPIKKTYKVMSSDEPAEIVRSARLAALKNITNYYWKNSLWILGELIRWRGIPAFNSVLLLDKA